MCKNKKKNLKQRIKYKPVESQKNIDHAAKKEREESRLSITVHGHQTSKRAQTDVCTVAAQGSARLRHSSIPDER